MPLPKEQSTDLTLNLTCDVEIGLSFWRQTDSVGGPALVPPTVVLVNARYH